MTSAGGNVATQVVGGEIRKKKMETDRWWSLQLRLTLQFDMVGIQILKGTY